MPDPEDIAGVHLDLPDDAEGGPDDPIALFEGDSDEPLIIFPDPSQGPTHPPAD
ncbi:hypothetical protein [Miltoncostaea oceani]|uniref:hypothetical protein n=1 Tax=Miltoncostaea oceani TaxID=2843216 RepID=UPI001C3C4BFB|nr:hypothetical protein [Miltoncostaea oceani]